MRGRWSPIGPLFQLIARRRGQLPIPRLPRGTAFVSGTAATGQSRRGGPLAGLAVVSPARRRHTHLAMRLFLPRMLPRECSFIHGSSWSTRLAASLGTSRYHVAASCPASDRRGTTICALSSGYYARTLPDDGGGGRVDYFDPREFPDESTDRLRRAARSSVFSPPSTSHRSRVSLGRFGPNSD